MSFIEDDNNLEFGIPRLGARTARDANRRRRQSQRAANKSRRKHSHGFMDGVKDKCNEALDALGLKTKGCHGGGKAGERRQRRMERQRERESRQWK